MPASFPGRRKGKRVTMGGGFTESSGENGTLKCDLTTTNDSGPGCAALLFSHGNPRAREPAAEELFAVLLT